MNILLKHRWTEFGLRHDVRLRKRHFACVLLCFGLLLLGFGFVRFVELVESQRPPHSVSIQGIVVLTGGKDRLGLSLDILQAQQEDMRLLISGVNPDVSLSDLAAQVPERADMLACCVDLGRKAVSTVGNAWETRDWVAKNNFNSILLVTSNYHMPRSLMELQRALPNTRITAYPLLHSGLELATWWKSPATAELMFKEYLKYLASYLRSKLPSQPQNFVSLEEPFSALRG